MCSFKAFNPQITVVSPGRINFIGEHTDYNMGFVLPTAIDKKTTNKGAIVGALVSIPIAMYFKVAPKGWSTSSFFVDVPFMDQMGYTCILTMLVIIMVSLYENKGADDTKAIPISRKLFKTNPKFNIGAFAIMIILVVLYSLFWK